MEGVRSARMAVALLAVVMMLLGSARGVPRSKDTAPTRQTQPGIGPNERGLPETEALDERVSAVLRDQRYAGAALGVAHNGRVIYTQGYGRTREGATMRPTTMRPASSLSKTITAAAALLLVQRGQLRLSDTVFGPGGVLAAVRPADGTRVDPRLLDITVEHLLHHSAGWSQTGPRLYDPLMNPVYLSRGHDVVDIAGELGLTRDLSAHDVIAYMVGQPLARPPGIRYEYSNFGYSVLGRVIEEVSGKKYAAYVRSEVLEPLGMWQTRIGSDRLAQARTGNHVTAVRFPEGDIPLAAGGRTGSFYALCDSSLGWWSTVYDLMRFATGLTSGLLLGPETLALLGRHPEAPVSEHRDTWHGLGVWTDEESWWQLGDPHDDEVILYHQATPTVPRAMRSRVRRPEENAWTWVVLLSDNNRKDLRGTFGPILSAVTQWPADNLLIEDCGEYLPRRSWKHSTFINTHIRESHFQAVLGAAARLRYHPFWISAYSVGRKTFLAAAFHQDPEEHSHRTASGVTKSELLSLEADQLGDGFFLDFVASYNSHRSGGGVRYAAIFGRTPSPHGRFGIGETGDEFGAALREAGGSHWPTEQSVAALDGVRQFTYSLSDAKVHSWKSFDNLTLDQLEVQIRLNANADRVLSSLDSYEQRGGPLFAAVFSPGQAGKWQVQTGIERHELALEVQMYRGLHFRPRILVGYECRGKACFVIMWKKHTEY